MFLQVAENKTKPTEASVEAFIEAFADSPQKRVDSFELLRLMKQWTGLEPKMWGPSIIGFGIYHYRSPSGHEGDMPLIGFSPRKAALTLYVNIPYSTHQDDLLQRLGKYKTGKGCIYVKRLSDLDLTVLEALAMSTIETLHRKSGQ